jgi:hypothetical protein
MRSNAPTILVKIIDLETLVAHVASVADVTAVGGREPPREPTTPPPTA